MKSKKIDNNNTKNEKKLDYSMANIKKRLARKIEIEKRKRARIVNISMAADFEITELAHESIHKQYLLQHIQFKKDGHLATVDGVMSLKDNLKLSIVSDDNLPEDGVVDAIVNLYKALTAYHIACGGNGLTIDDWQTFVGSETLEEVLS